MGPDRKGGAVRTVRVRGFATARAALGDRLWELPAAPDGVRIDRLLARLAARCPRLAPLLPTCRIFVNDEPARSLETRVRPGDEITLHPPYSGG